ncbi:unnamed protein product [Fraxinus pennsylvanica]|uniref:Alpha-1,3/1,6-mannosyltransferase ALG2 n=1 Tax=Fraxinus pennsylvanica TaxID=56036 RepID=A0AAD2A9V6_9LAMI|nr:unnamed protein product [Fraxinus pennsylvanica]
MEKKESSKLNIAIIHPDLGIGGAERLIVDAAVELATRGHHVHVFTSHHDKTRCFEETVSGIFPVTVYGAFLPRHVFYRLHAVCAYLRCIFVALCVLFMHPTFDIILADQVSVVIPLMKLKKSSKVVFYCHFPDLLLAQHTTVLRKMYRKPIDYIEEITTGMADLILVNSKFTASTFAKTFKHLDTRGIRPSVLYPAVNVDQFEKPTANNLNFLSINRFERKKNIELAISAFAMLYTDPRNIIQGDNENGVSLVIVGGFDKRLRENVEYLEELKNLADREGVSHRVRFITSCTTTERNTLLSECLCVLYTPKDEHFGIVPLEAMAAHKPVIACNSGGPVETVKNGVTGFLCDPSPQEFSTAMANFIRDPQMSEAMGREARKHVHQSNKFRHWGYFEGPFKGHAPTGELVQFYGIGILNVDESRRAEDVEIYYDPKKLLQPANYIYISACKSSTILAFHNFITFFKLFTNSNPIELDMARYARFSLILIVVLICFTQSLEARKFLEDKISTLEESSVMSALPKGTIPPSSPSERGNVVANGGKLFGVQPGHVDRSLVSIPSPGIGN